MVFKLNSRWPETRVCCPKTLCSGHIENKGVVGTLPGIDTQGSYVAVVFRLNSRWPDLRPRFAALKHSVQATLNIKVL